MAVLEAVLAVFNAIATWFSESLSSMIPIFWTDGSNGTGTLTFFGVLAVAGLGFSIVFLVLGIIQRFLHFRG